MSFTKLKQEQEFNPSFKGIWLNGSYLIRRIISNAIRDNAPLLPGKLLDYGCGSRPYEHFFPQNEYVGADIETSGHPSDRKRADIYFKDMRLPVNDAEFDSVLASEVLEHVFDLPASLADINRVLRPGGRVLVTCPFVWPLHEEPYDFARYTPYALKQEFEKAGFRVLKQEQHGSPVEVLAQLFLAQILPHLLPDIPKVGPLIHHAVCGIVNGGARLLTKIKKQQPPGLYLTNVLVAEKLMPV